MPGTDNFMIINLTLAERAVIVSVPPSYQEPVCLPAVRGVPSYPIRVKNGMVEIGVQE